ncbi:MAG: hypothetical protein AAF170_09140 [Bacteroidota bacterium]
MRVALCLVALALLFASSPAWAQSWPTTDWVIVREDEESLTAQQAQGAEFYRQQLEDASQWYQAAGFRPPRMLREQDNAGAYVGYIKTNTTSLGASYTNERGEYSDAWLDWTIEHITDFLNPGQRFFLSGNPGAWAPSSRWETTMSYGPAHELFHAVQAAYGRPTGVPGPSACVRRGGQAKIGAEDWAWEGMSSAVQIRYLERDRTVQFQHPYRSSRFAAWTRYFDHPLHEPRHRKPPHTETLSWYCGYGSWYFWYAAGEMLGDTPIEKIGYLQYVLDGSQDWSDLGLANVDSGLKDAAEVYGTSRRYDEGLFEVYPAFIAEYADDKRFYEAPVAMDLRGRSEVKWHTDVIDPVATTAFEVSINVDDNATQASRFMVTLDSQENRDQLHLIAGQVVYAQPSADEDPYSFTLPVLRDTTILVRLANVGRTATETEKLRYNIRFELGGFYGAPASGPYVAPNVDIPPGFNVMSGPPQLVGCQGGADGGSVFDLITAAEAVGDIRRLETNANQTLQDMDEALEDGEFPMPNATPQQRAAMKRMIESGAISQAQIAQMRAAIAEAQAEMEGYRPDIDQARAKMAREYQDRSRLIANFVGKAAGKTCQVILAAGLRGEEGGAQQLSTADYANQPDDAPLPVGIENVGYLVGDSQAEMMQALGANDAFSICMMTPEEQARDQRSSCPRGCSGGRLILEEASQGHAKGTLRVDLIRQRDAGPNARCPQIDRRELVVGFNITSANSGQDADVFRGISDEMFRMMGVDQAGLDLFRGAMNGRMFR